MKTAQIYCTLDELIEDLTLPGDEPQLFNRIQTASQFMQQEFDCAFLPITEARTFDGPGCYHHDLVTGALLSITSVTVDGVAVSDYTAYPRKRCWLNGPYTYLRRDAGWGQTVVVAGIWGMYDQQEDLGISLTQTLGAATLVVPNGSLVSAGMVVLIESEQEMVTGWGSPSLATSQLNGAIDNAAEILQVDNGAEFFAGETIVIGMEDMAILKIVGNDLAVMRGYNATTKAAHSDNAPVYVYRTFNVSRGVNGTTAAAHNAAAAFRCLVPADVNNLCRQIAGLVRAKAKTGFGGRAGDPERGETFYVNEFPRQIGDIKANYALPYL